MKSDDSSEFNYRRERLAAIRSILQKGGMQRTNGAWISSKLREFGLLFSGVASVDQMSAENWDDLLSFLDDFHRRNGAKALADYVNDALGYELTPAL